MKRSPVLLASLFFAVGVLAPPGGAQARPLLDPGLRDLLHEALSGELAKEHVYAITRHHRIQGSRGYRDAAQYVLEQLRGYGLGEEDAYVESFPSDGRVHYQTWQSPSGWDVDAAELRMVEPYDERICGYPEVAMSLITYSNAGSAEAELVWVGAGTRASDYEGRDVAGKFVLATGYGGAVHREAVLARGAVGVVCYLDDHRAQEYPDMLAYTGMWPKTDELEATTFGFNLSSRQGEKLRGLLERGEKVVLRGQVEGTGLEPFFMDVVVATIRGSEKPDEELLFTAHLDHPKESANDNASGSAALLDIVRALQGLIEDGRMQRPKRTLRFLWVPEWYGTMAYIDAHPELCGPILGGKVLANLNLDMVGENTELLHCRLELTRTPASLPTVVDDVVANMAAMVDDMDIRTPRGSLGAFNYRITRFAGGSDHMMLIDRKVPGVMFWHTPDYTHHTSEDTPDKVDPVQLERCEMIAAGTALFLANADAEDAAQLAWLALEEGVRVVTEEGRRAIAWLDETPDEELGRTLLDADRILRAAMHQQRAALLDVANFHGSEEMDARLLDFQFSLRRVTGEHQKRLRDLVKKRLGREPTPEEQAEPPKDLRIAERTTRGPLAFDLPERELGGERLAWYREPDFPLTGDMRFELVNFVNGENTVTHVRHFLTAEFGPVPVEAVARYMEDLVSIGALAWKPEAASSTAPDSRADDE